MYGVPVAAWPVLEEHLGHGLVVLLSPGSESVAALISGRPDLAEELLAPWRRIAEARPRLLRGLPLGLRHVIFHSGLLLVRGTVEARGPRRTMVGEMVWDLEAVAATRRDHGPQAALDLIGHTTTAPTTPVAAGEGASGRALQDGTAGSQLHAWADLQPTGSRAADLRRLGHRSSGSAG
ncbi:hypothetical protein GCM10010449_06290 [Streptomyces rectiviolaceus]|uniref:Uncharacterized protein n=1 Tax=Streptomyces rectiviolaceus TaxID=332591 RepID=A0ABP6MBE8_9ACTN